jgi:SAM-dependent methyltransferase
MSDAAAAALVGVREMYDRDARAYAALRAGWLRAGSAFAVHRLDLADARVVVEVACGTGSGLEELRTAAPKARLVGLDLSAAMLRQIDRAFTVAQADAAKLPVANGVCDAVVCCFALMHLPSPAGAVAEFARVLRAGGSVALATWGADVPWPARDGVLAILDDLGAPAVSSSHHGAAVCDSAEKVEHLLFDAGFDQISTDSAPLPADASLDVETTLQAWSSLGSTAVRLQALEPAAREEYYRRARSMLSEVDHVEFSDPRTVIYAWGRKRRG